MYTVDAAPAINAGNCRLLEALQVLREAPSDLLIGHADAIVAAHSTIEALVTVIAPSQTRPTCGIDPL
jgi:hypothetical protein